MAELFHKTFVDAATGANGFDSVSATNGTIEQSAGAGLNGTSGGITCTRTANSPSTFGTITSDFAGKTILRTAWRTNLTSMTIGTDGHLTRLYTFLRNTGASEAAEVILVLVAGALNLRHTVTQESTLQLVNDVPLVGLPSWIELRLQRSSGVAATDAQSHLYIGGGDYPTLGTLISTHVGFNNYTRFERNSHRLGMRLGGATVGGSLIVDEWTMRDDDTPILFGVSESTSPFLTYLRRRRRV